MRNKCVDIIIPVYNAFEDLQICVESLKRNTDLKKHRLILINDNSPDERIKPFLDLQKSDNIFVFHNEKNQGFSANINLGMSQSVENDVVLLNSDTIVTKNWVEKMLDCAYSSVTIGTVTPLSNNATLCSVPKFCEENVLPDYLTVDKAAEIVEKVSFCDYPRITVAHGFCMFVKRKVIDKIGGFDAETFQRGYGEENDFCNRAEQAGYIHVMCDNTYIYHSGTKSFVSKEKEKLIREHEKILEQRYPVQMHNNAVYCRDNPNKYVCDNVGLFFELNNGKKNILYILHSDFKAGRNDNIGGTQFHVKDLKDGLCADNNIFVLARNMEMLCLTIYCDNQEFNFSFYVGKADDIILESNRKIREVIDAILEAFSIDLIHVHHIIGLSYDIFDLANEKSIPIILTAHDFYYICPTVTLISKEGRKCCNENVEQCKQCLRDTKGFIETVNYLELWREKTRKIFGYCSQIIFPSENTKMHYSKVYPEYNSKFIVIEHGVNYNSQELINSAMQSEERKEFIFDIDKVDEIGANYQLKGWINAFRVDLYQESFYLKISNESNDEKFVPIQLSSIDYSKGVVARFDCIIPNDAAFYGRIKALLVLCDGEKVYLPQTKAKDIELKVKKDNYKLRVAFIGGLSVSKGSQIIRKIINNGANDIHWFTFGTIGDIELHNIRKNNYTELGTYNNRDLNMLMDIHNIDIVGIMSIWSETYSYTLSEAIINNKPVIVTDIGAPGDRIRKYGCGYHVSLECADKEFIQCIDKLKNNSELLNELVEKVTNLKLKSVGQMVLDYKSLYSGILQNNHKCLTGSYDRRFIYRSLQNTNIDKGIQIIEETTVNELWMREAKEYQILKSTLTYQIIMKFINMRFPFKKRIMDLIYKMRSKS